MKKYFLLTLILFFSISMSGQDKVVLRQTFIKVKPGNNTLKTLRLNSAKWLKKELMQDTKKVGISGK